MTITPPYYPIVYIRGFAATMGEIEDTVATPYMGFNLGSTKIRQNHEGEIVRFIFESPLIRLMKEEGYVDTYANGDLLPRGIRSLARSVWIFRYYEPMSESLGEGERRDILEIAADLRRFILRIRGQVCGDDPQARAAFRVYLVAHSMGGLIARAYLQNLCINGSGDGALDAELELPGAHLVDKVFTYGTPHGGIEFRGLNVPDLGRLDPFHVRNFNREVMRDYLDLPADEDVRSLGGRFPPQRFFCFIGSNHRDYTAFFNLSRKGTGPMSDGLVMLQNAAVAGAPRAVAYRSHSGHYGLVNSEEGYQNLRRFLFGRWQVNVLLQVAELTLPEPLQRLKEQGREIRAAYYIESEGRVRGAPYFLHQRRVDQNSAIRRTYDALVKARKPVYLFSTYLDPRARTSAPGKALAFALRVAIQVPLYEVDRRFWFDEYYEGGYLLDETLTFHIQPGGNLRYGLASQHGVGVARKAPQREALDGGGLRFTIPLGFKEGMAKPPRPGFRGSLVLEARPWNRQDGAA